MKRSSNFVRSMVCVAALLALACAMNNAGAASIADINSVRITPRAFNDVPGAPHTEVNNYPGTVSFTEQNVSAPAPAFANRDLWQFSGDNGATAYQFGSAEYFHAQFDLTLTGTPIAPRKEAGFLFSTGSNGDVQFIVNTDGHEVVQFGGISFYSFNANNGLSYNSGDRITMGLTYFLDGNGKNALQFSANGINSPVFEFGPTVGSGANDIGTGSTLGAYFQIVNDPNNALNSGSAVFQNLSITQVPEPSSLALLALGGLSLLFRRRK